MIKEAQNKIIGKSETKTTLKTYFFPEYQITIKSDSLENAQKQLLEFINKKEND
jgi:hypothetical protein